MVPCNRVEYQEAGPTACARAPAKLNHWSFLSFWTACQVLSAGVLCAQADAKAKQEAAEAQRRKDEEKIRAGMERARREAEASRTADEQRVRPGMLSVPVHSISA